MRGRRGVAGEIETSRPLIDLQRGKRMAEMVRGEENEMQTWRRSVIALAFFSAIAIPLAALGEEEDDLALAFGEKSTVSIATGSQQMLSRAPAVATVITAEEIRNMGAQDIDEVLVRVPGLHVSKSESLSTSQYLIRGMTSTYNPQVLMLMNGVPMTSVYLGNRTDFGTSLPVENISRIEVIRGPGSALYGADAFSGVINIVTKNAREIGGLRYGVGIGSFNTQNSWVQYGGELGGIEVASYLRVGKTDGQHGRIAVDAATALDAAMGTSVSRAPGQVHEGYGAIDGQLDMHYADWRVRFGYRLRDDFQTGPGVADALDPAGRGRSERITTDIIWHDAAFRPDWDVSAQMSFMDQANQVVTPVELFPAGAFGTAGGACGGLCYPNGMLAAPSKWERALRSSFTANYTGWARHQVRWGVGHDIQQIYRVEETKNFTFVLTPSGPFPFPLGGMVDVSNTAPFLKTGRRTVNYAYVQDEWNFTPDWTLTAGVRHDKYSDFGGTTNPRLALVWDTAQNITTKFMLGRAFRAPSWIELYSLNNPVVQGNSNLRPETVTTAEAAVSWQATGSLQINANVFRYQWNDIIRFVPNAVATTGATAQNSGKQHGQGLEVEATWDVSRELRLAGSFSTQRSIDETTNQDAGLAPHRRYFGQASWRFAPLWTLDTSINHVADRRRQPGDTREAIKDYTKVDLAVRRERMFGNWELRATIANLFDADVREPSLAPASNLPFDLPMPGRTWYLQLIHSL